MGRYAGMLVCVVCGMIWCVSPGRRTDGFSRTAESTVTREIDAERLWEHNRGYFQENWPDDTSGGGLVRLLGEKYDVIAHCREGFLRLAGCDNADAEVQKFVRRFGKEGAKADFVWLISFYGGMLPLRLGEVTVDPGTGASSVPLREACRTIARTQATMFLEDKRLLQRYCELVVWSGVLGGHRPLACFWDIDRNIEGEDYWWHARNLITLLHLTGRDDLLENVDPSGLANVFRKWRDWYLQNSPYLRFDRAARCWRVDQDARLRREGYLPLLMWGEWPSPEMLNTPFADWTGPPPCSPKDLRVEWEMREP